MKHFIPYCIVVCMIMGYASCTAPKSPLPDMREKYGQSNKNPFGALSAYRILQNIYPTQTIESSTKKFTTFYDDMEVDSGSLYVNISNKYLLAEDDASSLLNYVYNGNTAFIAAADFDSNFLNRLSTEISTSSWNNIFENFPYKKTTVSLLPDEFSVKDSFSYFYESFNHYFAASDAKKSRVTGYGSNGRANFLIFFWGKGRLYLHCEPRAFSNYFLLTNDNYLYMTQVMQMMDEKPAAIYWDEYYNKINYKERSDHKPSAISALLKEPPLANAFWLLLSMLLLYILINGKRKQRIVPIIPPTQNTSVAYTEAVAGVYMAEKNNKNIADKMITYFNEHIRNRYFLHMYAGNDDQVSVLSRKSGVATEKVKEMYEHIQFINKANYVSDIELLTLNMHIQNFYKNRL